MGVKSNIQWTDVTWKKYMIISSTVLFLFVYLQTMAQTAEGRIKQFCNKHGIEFSFYQSQVTNGLKWCFKCSDWKDKDNFAIDNSRYDKKKAACFDCGRVKEKISRKGTPSVFKGKKHSEENIEKLRQKNKGEGNPNWKGGITRLLTQIRNTQKYKEWRLRIYHIGKFTCSKCGKQKSGSNIILDADHIIPLAKIVYQNKVKSVDEALKCDAIFDYMNGRCLCRQCHKETDTWGVNVNKL